MKLELTERDILLLKLSGIALIVFMTVRFLIMPGITGWQERRLENELLQDTIEEMEAAIQSIPLMEKSIEEKQRELSERSLRYYEKMENHQVDELLTGLALKHGLFPVSLAIGEAGAKIPEPYRYGETTDSAEILSEGYILTGSASMVLRGDEDAVYAFLDDIEDHFPAVRVVSMRLEERAWLDADGTAFMQTDAGFELEIVMYDPETVQ